MGGECEFNHKDIRWIVRWSVTDGFYFIRWEEWIGTVDKVIHIWEEPERKRRYCKEYKDYDRGVKELLETLFLDSWGTRYVMVTGKIPEKLDKGLNIIPKSVFVHRL